MYEYIQSSQYPVSSGVAPDPSIYPVKPACNHVILILPFAHDLYFNFGRRVER